MWKPDYATGEQVKKFAKIDDDIDDEEFALYASAASRAVDRCTGRQFGLVAAPEQRAYPVRWTRARHRWIAAIDDLMTEVGLTGVADYILLPRNAAQEGKPWEVMAFTADPRDSNGEITPTARWGWSAVPPSVGLATRLQGNRFAARRDSPFGVAGSPQAGTELRLLERADPDVAVSLKAYRREWWAQ